MHVVSANQSFYRTFQTRPEEITQRVIFELGAGQWDIPELRRMLEQVLPRQRLFEDFEVQKEFPLIGHRVMLLNARRLELAPEQPGLILLAMEDVTDQQRSKIAL
jgi:two-component system CheB/CheR fusion protein